jgi:hypothetical protein
LTFRISLNALPKAGSVLFVVVVFPCFCAVKRSGKTTTTTTAAGSKKMENAVAQKLIALNIRPISLCHQLAECHPESHIDAVITAARQQAKTSVAGWVRRALEEGWIVENVANQKAKEQEEAKLKMKAEECRNRDEGEKERQLTQKAEALLNFPPYGGRGEVTN